MTKTTRIDHSTIPLLHQITGKEATRPLTQSSNLRGLNFMVPKGEIGRGEKAFTTLKQVIGAEAASRMCKHFGGGVLYIPKDRKNKLNERDRRIVAAFDKGSTVPQLAAEFDLTDRRIRSILKETDATTAD